MRLSIVIPAYNEEERLPQTLILLEQFFAEEQKKGEIVLHEVIVVDDGSTDHTAEIAEQWSRRIPLRMLRYPNNRGKGAALKRGVQSALGEYILLYDADAATPMEEVRKLQFALQREHADIAIGSRIHQEDPAHVQMQRHRRAIGAIYHFLTAPLIPGIKDAACGCKLFHRGAAQHLFQHLTLDRFAYDIELLSLAKKCGYRIVEVPVRWRSVPVSKVRLLRDGCEMFYRVIGLYMRDATFLRTIVERKKDCPADTPHT